MGLEPVSYSFQTDLPLLDVTIQNLIEYQDRENVLTGDVVTASFTTNNTHYFVEVDCSGSSVTATLDSFDNVREGVTLFFKDVTGSAASNNIIIDGNGTNIDGASTYTITTAYGCVQLRRGVSTWNIITTLS